MSETSEQPLVSVVLPTYDRPEMLLEAVESVAAQRYSNVELLVVDDGSPTPARTVLESAAPEDVDWRCLRHEENRGANAARNTGIRAAEGEILAFLDDDDRWLPDKLEAQMAAFRDRDVGVVLVGQQFVTEDETATTTILPTVEGDATPGLIDDGIGGPFSTIAVRRSVVDEAGLPDDRFPAWQDREWLLRLSCHCRFAAVREPLVVRRSGSYAQIGDRFEPKRDTTYPLFVEKHRELAAEHGRERQFLARLATRIAAAGLANGHYADARKFAAKAIRTNPAVRDAYLYFLLSLGGDRTYRSAARFKRTVDQLRRAVPGSSI